MAGKEKAEERIITLTQQQANQLNQLAAEQTQAISRTDLYLKGIGDANDFTKGSTWNLVRLDGVELKLRKQG